MPRRTELLGYRFAVGDAIIPVADDRGNIVHDAQGAPKTEKVKQIVSFDQTGDQITVALPDEGRKELIRLLTGVHVAQAGDMVHH